MEQAIASSSMTEDDRYPEALAGIQEHFDALVRTSPQLFVTDAAGLWEAYLDSAPPGTRQSWTCNCCRAFVQRFGGLVSISGAGETKSAVWPNDAPPQYADAVRVLSRIVERAKVVGVFRSKDATWGTPKTGPWTHMALVAPPQVRSTSALSTPHQEMAAKVEEYGMLQRSLAEFDVEAVRKALALLTSEGLYRSEKCEGVARWLLNLHEAIGATKNARAKANLVWLAVAKAPPGYCHVRSGMIGTLLEDITADLPFEAVKRKWVEKMNPLQYMRPQAAPSAGNIAQAEKVVAALQSAGALDRRFAKLADVQSLWLPKAPQEAKAEPKGGAFGHLVPKAKDAITTNDAPPTVMTWAKFSANVLPNAEGIEFLVPSGREPYTAMVTAKNAEAPNLLQWDNPVSHYVYHSGSPPDMWNLTAGRYHRVSAVVLRSWMWGPDKFSHHGAGVVFVLDGCRDVTYQRSGGMFPEQMKSEYHAVRRTLEAFFQSATIEGKDEAEVCGVVLQKGATWNLVFRITSRGVRTTYKLDRWD